MAWWRIAGQVPTLAVLACVLYRALASVAPDIVDAHAVILAGWWAHIALIDILFAGLSWEEGRAGADVVGLDGRAVATIGTGIGGTGISLLAQFSWGHREMMVWFMLCLLLLVTSPAIIMLYVTWPSRWAAALVRLDTLELAGASIKTRRDDTGIDNGCHAAAVSVAKFTGAVEVHRISLGYGATRAAIHARRRCAWVAKLATASHVAICTP